MLPGDEEVVHDTDARSWAGDSAPSAGTKNRPPLPRLALYALDGLKTHGLTFLRDALIVAAAFYAGDLARFDGHVPLAYDHGLILALAFIIPVYVLSVYLWGVHRRMWQYASIPDLRTLLQAWVTGTAIVMAADLAVGREFFLPMSVVLMGSVFAVGGMVLARLWRRFGWRTRAHTSNRILIVGAGRAGQIVAKDLAMGPEHPVGFIDDDPGKWNRIILGIPVLGPIDQLHEVVVSHGVDTIAVAIPSASTRELDRVLALAQETEARIQILPSQAEVLSGRSSSMTLRDIKLESVLERIPSTDVLQSALVRETIGGRVVLVTGGAGSIGSEICRQLITLNPARVLALDNNESGLFHLVQEMSQKPGGECLIPVLASVTAGPKLGRVFEQYRPDIVFHAAAYKHVPMLEEHCDEAVFVNVQGTLNVCQRAVEFGCERVVFISTDKAVHPVNTLGYSKRIGEMLVRAHQQQSPTVFCSVRFGNVMGSRGSAIPEFIRQIQSGGPVKVTHPDVQRFFMTIPEAVSLVIQASSLAGGGEIFMLDMGSPIKVGDLVKRLIRLHGLRIGKDVEITYTGLRPGEKLTEELVFETEEARETDVPGIRLVLDDAVPSLPELQASVRTLVQLATQSEAALPELLSSIARGNDTESSLMPATG